MVTVIDRSHRPGRGADATSLLRVSDLRKSYATPQGRLPVLGGVDLTLAAGESLALLGESGSGKSTLLHLIGGLDEADGGEIVLDGVRITGHEGRDIERIGGFCRLRLRGDVLLDLILGTDSQLAHDR